LLSFTATQVSVRNSSCRIARKVAAEKSPSDARNHVRRVQLKHANLRLPRAQEALVQRCGKLHGAVNMNGAKVCEGCGAKHANYGIQAKRSKRWCMGCGKAHGAVQLNIKRRSPKSGSSAAGFYIPASMYADTPHAGPAVDAIRQQRHPLPQPYSLQQQLAHVLAASFAAGMVSTPLAAQLQEDQPPVAPPLFLQQPQLDPHLQPHPHLELQMQRKRRRSTAISRNKSKCPYAQSIMGPSGAENVAAQQLAYRTLLMNIPAHPTHQSIMATLVRDELREILQVREKEQTPPCFPTSRLKNDELPRSARDRQTQRKNSERGRFSHRSICCPTTSPGPKTR